MNRETMKQPSQRFFPTQTSRIRWFIPLLMGLLLIPGASIALQASVHSPHNGPDLVVTAITFDPPNPGAGTTGDIEVTVKNIGTEIAPAGFRTYIYVDPTDDPPNQSTGITTRVFRGQALDVNDTFTFARTDHEFTSDNPVVYAWVDPIWENNIVETDDNNNYLRVPSDPPPPNYEPNNDCNQATPINLNTEIQEHNLTPSGGLGSDHDWIQFNTVRGQKYTVHIDAPGADADLYAEYYTFCGGTPALGSGLEIEIESDHNGPYYLKIGHNQIEYGPDTAYTVSVITEDPPPVPTPDPYEPDNDCNQATPINLNTEIQEHNLTPSGGLGSDHDWIQFNTVRGQKYTVHIDAPGADADLYAEYYTFCGGTPALGSGLKIEIESDVNGPYYLKIGHNQLEYGPDTAYTVSVTTGTSEPPTTEPTPTPNSPGPDRFEPDNDCNQATPISAEIQEHNLVPSDGLDSDHDWVQFDALRGQEYIVTITAPGADADLYAEYYTFCSGTPALGSGLIIEIKSDLNGPYYLKIGHNQPEYGPDTAYTVSVTTNTNVTPYTVTPTATSTATDMPPRPTDTHTPTVTPTNTGTNTRTNTPTNTPTGTETNTPTTISTSTPTHTNTPTLTRIPTRTPTRANTPTPTVTPSPVPSDATWTLLIYAMGDNDLERYLEDSRHGMIGRFKKLEDVVEEGVQVAIMFDGNDLGDTKYYTLDENGKWTEERPIAGTEARMDEPETLETFLKWGARRYPKSDYYALSLLGHASALLGMGPDESTDTTRGSFLEPNEIRDAIDDAQGNASFHINVIHFDGCSFGLFESTSIIHDTGNSNDMEPTYVIASPNTGWGFFAHEIYRGIAGDSSTPAAYAQSVAQYYAKKVAAEALPYTISVLDVAHYTAVKNATDALGNALTFYVNAQDTDARHSTLRQRRGASQIYDSGDYEIDERYDTYVDLRDLIDNFEIIADTRVETARVGIQEALDRFVLYTENKSGFMDGNQNYHDLENAKGIAIFYPYGEMTGPIWERYVGADNSRDVSSQSQADPLFPNLTEGWGWTEFIKTLPPPPTGTPIEGSLREIEVNILSPKVDPFYDELVRTVEEQDFIVYLPIITR